MGRYPKFTITCPTPIPRLQAVRHVFQQRPFILTNEFFHAELVDFAAHRGLLFSPVLPPTSEEALPERCPKSPSSRDSEGSCPLDDGIAADSEGAQPCDCAAWALTTAL